MSKFDYDNFYGDIDAFAVNAEKFTKAEATALFEREVGGPQDNVKIGTGLHEYRIDQAFVKWRAGVDEDGDPRVCWWLEYHKRKKGSCPSWVFVQNWHEDVKPINKWEAQR